MEIKLTKKQIWALMVLTNNQHELKKLIKDNYDSYEDEGMGYSITELSNSLDYDKFWDKLNKSLGRKNANPILNEEKGVKNE